MRAAARRCSGFLYVVSRPGTTGARTGLPRDLAATARRARRAAGDLPIAIGFGISTAESARRAAELADGVVVGSALVAEAERARERPESTTGPVERVERLARELAGACRRREP
jgi:tryptophan synthase alpha chain